MFLILFSFLLGGAFSVNVDYFQFFQFNTTNSVCSGYPTGKAYYVRDECYGYNYDSTDLSMKFHLATTTSANMTMYAGSTCDEVVSSTQIPFMCFHPAASKDEQWDFYQGEMVTARTYGGSDCSDASAIIATNTFKPDDCMPYHPEDTLLSSTLGGVRWPTKNTRGIMLIFEGWGVQLTAFSTATCNPFSVITGTTLYFSFNNCNPVDSEDSIIFNHYSSYIKKLTKPRVLSMGKSF